MMNLPPQVNTVLSMLESEGFEAFLVGGAVRDSLMEGRAAKDWDIATNARPEQVKGVFRDSNLIETGLKHGTVTVVLDHIPLEITTYRIDGEYSDHRRPDAVQFTRSLEQDLKRRDFTMNAVAFHPQTGIIDLVGGVNDIRNGLVRCVGVPDQRFQEDALRILRALRFASVYGMRIEKDTAAAIHRNRDLLNSIAVERVQVELIKLLCGKNLREILHEFSDVLAVSIPEVSPMFGFEQRNPHHDKDIWNHTIAVIDSIPDVSVLRWAALLHDIGKPSCFSVAEDGIGHFYGHAQQSADIADTVLRRLRFDTASRERITQLVRYHDLPIAPERKQVKRLMNKLGVDAVRQLILLHQADTYGQSDICKGRIEEYQEVSLVLDEILQEKSCFSLKDLAVNGKDMIALGFQGKEIGTVLDSCLAAVMEEQVPNDRVALITFASHQF